LVSRHGTRRRYHHLVVVTSTPGKITTTIYTTPVTACRELLRMFTRQ
jgi:hypothetical protein